MKRISVLTLFFMFFTAALGVCDEGHSLEREQSEILFVRRIAPLLREKCIACHGGDSDTIEGSLDLRSLKSLIEGGDSGEAGVRPGKPGESPLLLAVRRDHDDWSAMPPKEAEKLDDEQLSWLREWIATGAAWPEEERRSKIAATYADKWSAEDGITVETSGGLSPEWTKRKYDPSGLWAYQPLQRVEIPQHELDARNPIDFLIEKALPAGLRVASSASRPGRLHHKSFSQQDFV